jgi:hypothetical protein
MDYLKFIFNDKRKVDFYLEAQVLHLQSDEHRKDVESMSLRQRHQIKYDKARQKSGLSLKQKVLPPSIWLHKLEESVKWCLDSKIREEKCPYKNARIHSTDLRNLNILSKMKSELNTIQTQQDWDKYKDTYKHEILSMSNINDCNYYIKYIKKFFNDPVSKKSGMGPIMKQIIKSGISEKDIDTAMLTVCNSKINPLSHLIKSYQNINKTSPAVYARMFSEYLKSPTPIPYNILNSNEFVETTQSQVSMLVDVYTFLRMLRPFKDGPQKYIVFYGGINHCENLNSCFKQLDLKLFRINLKCSVHL